MRAIALLASLCAASCAAFGADRPRAVPLRAALQLRGGGATLPEAVVAAAGSAFSISGVASLVNPRWLKDERFSREVSREDDEAADGERPPSDVHDPISMASCLSLIGWGLAKLSILRLVHRNELHRICRVTGVPLLFAFFLSGGKTLPALPRSGQALLAGLYACVGLGVRKIPKPGKVGIPDRFYDYLTPAEKRVHLI